MMKKTLFILIICLSGIFGGVSAQIKPFDDDGEYVSGRSIADIDMDGVRDTLGFDADTKQLFCLLSGRNFDTLSLGTTPEDWFLTYIEACDGGIIGGDYDMRYTLHYDWAFEKETGKFRLTEYSGDYLGDASNDGSGRMTLDLLTGEFTADWYYYDDEKDSLIGLPTARVHVDNPPVYFGDSTDFAFPGYELYNYYKKEYKPPYCDTVRFVSYIYDAIFPPTLYGRSSDGGQHYFTVGSGYRELMRGDIVRLTMEIECYYKEPEEGYEDEGSYRAEMMASDIEVIEPGKLRVFTENNKKAIDYRDDSKLAETWESRRLDGIDYFIAVGNDRQVEKYLHRPGTLWVHLHDFINPGPRDIGRESIFFLAELYNEHNGKREEVCRIVMEMTAGYDTLYFRYDNKTDELTPLNLEF